MTSIANPTQKTAPSVSSTSASPAAPPGATSSLTAFLDLLPSAAPDANLAPPRQAEAEDGKPLPVDTKPDDTADAALAWLGVGTATPSPTPADSLWCASPRATPPVATVPTDPIILVDPSAAPPAGLPVLAAPTDPIILVDPATIPAPKPSSDAGVTVSPIASAPRILTTKPTPPVTAAPVDPIILVDPATIPAPTPSPDADATVSPIASAPRILTTTPGAVTDKPVPADEKVKLSPIASRPRILTTTPVTAVPADPIILVDPATPMRATIETAQRAFAEAIHRATANDDRAVTDDKPSLAALTATATGAISSAAVQATGLVQQSALDMRHDHWPQAMIDRIEAMRDMANANDTSIRLVPDALGKIDVSLRRDGDTVHVHFAAEQAQTRAILADAHPRLTELAEARGLRLTQGGADARGDSGQSSRQQQTARTPAAPPSARRAAKTDTDTTDHRIA